MNKGLSFEEWYEQWIITRQNRGIKIEKRDYQKEKLRDIIDNAPAVLGYVLCAAPNAGKTFIAIVYIDWLFYNNPQLRALVLCRGNTELRDQFRSEVEFFQPDFISSLYNQEDNSTGTIFIDLPQTISKRDIGEIDVLIVDEAHDYYFADDGMVYGIITECRPKIRLLMTGTPAVFIHANKTEPDDTKKYRLSFISVHTLWNLGHAQDVLVEVASTTYRYALTDYNDRDELRGNVSVTPAQIKQTMFNMMEKILERLNSRVKMRPEEHKKKQTEGSPIKQIRKIVVERDNLFRDKIGKTMIVCKRVQETVWVKEFLLDYGYREDQIIKSTADTSDGKDIETFKTDDSKFLIVVYRGVLGLNYSELSNIIDISGSKHVNRTFQLYCRLIRKSDKIKDKFYYKVVPTELVEFFSTFMAGVLHLSHEHFLESYDGHNFYDMPVLLNTARVNVGISTVGPMVRRGEVTGTTPALNLQMVFEMIKLWHKGVYALDSRSYMTLRKAMELLGAIKHKDIPITIEDAASAVRAAMEMHAAQEES